MTHARLRVFAPLAFLLAFGLTACEQDDSSDDGGGGILPGAVPVGQDDGNGGGDDPDPIGEGEDPPVEGEDPPVEGEDPPVEGEDPPVEVEDPPDEEEEPPVEEPTGCSGNGFEPQFERGLMTDLGRRYEAQTGNRYPYDVMVIDIRSEQGGPSEAGTFALDQGADLANCDLCVYALKGCDPESGQCEGVYVPDEGEIEITRIGSAGRQFQAELKGAHFIEVEVDNNTLQTTPVAGGGDWCADGHAIDVELEPPPANLGDEVADFSLQNCETEEFVSVEDLGLYTNALWIVGAAGWCSACRQFLPQVIRYAESVPRGQMRAIVVMGEDFNFGQPTLDFCRQYAARYDVNASRFFIDHNGQRSFATLFRNLNPYTGPNGEFGLPWNALIEGRTLRYYYADRSPDNVSDLPTALETLVAGEGQ